MKRASWPPQPPRGVQRGVSVANALSGCQSVFRDRRNPDRLSFASKKQLFELSQSVNTIDSFISHSWAYQKHRAHSVRGGCCAEDCRPGGLPCYLLHRSVAGKKNSRSEEGGIDSGGWTNRLEHRAPPRGGWTFADVLLPGQH